MLPVRAPVKAGPRKAAPEVAQFDNKVKQKKYKSFLYISFVASI